jgi:glycerol-3-phosphate cytidylyltransferase
MGNVITYGTFDLLHYGHIELLRRAKALNKNGKLIVALSSDNFNSIKGKKSSFDYSKRKKLLRSISYVDMIIREDNWEQKRTDIINYNVEYFVIGDDWKGHFDELKDICKVVYLSRTPDISSTAIKKIIKK